MTPIEDDARQYVLWMQVHNYARTTIECRERYLGYFVCFADARGLCEVESISFETLQDYQQQLFAHRKVDCLPLSFGTQVQHPVSVTQLFSWLRRRGGSSPTPPVISRCPGRTCAFSRRPRAPPRCRRC